MPSIHIGTRTLTNANVALPLTPTRVMARQLFIQGNQLFSFGDSTVTTTTGILCSIANAAAGASNGPHTPVLGTTAAQPIINLNEIYCVSATGGAIIAFAYIP